MFDQLFTSSSAIARHVTTPYAQERIRYLDYCRQRGDRVTPPGIVATKTSGLPWIARKLSVHSDLHVTIDQIRAVVVDGGDHKALRGFVGQKVMLLSSGPMCVAYSTQSGHSVQRYPAG